MGACGGMCGRGCACGGHVWWGGHAGGRGACMAQGCVRGMHAPHVDRMTDACKNITLPQTSYAGGKYERTRNTFPPFI